MDNIIVVLRILLIASYGAVASAYVAGFLLKPDSGYNFTRVVRIIGIAIHCTLIAAMWIDQKHFPFDTVFQGLMFCSLVLSLLFSALDYTESQKSFGVFLWPLNFLIIVISSRFLYNGKQLPVSMHSPYFITHVTLVFSAYACFLFSFSTSLMYLIQYNLIKHKRIGTVFNRLPSLSLMDRSILRADGVGLGLFFMGLLQGYLWSETAGVPFGRIGVKAAFALIASMFYLGEHILRVGKGWQGSRASYLSIAGFTFIMATLVAGRHGF